MVKAINHRQLPDAMRRVWRVLKPRDRQIWLVLVGLGTVVALLEALTAGAALLLARQLTSTSIDGTVAVLELENLRRQVTPGLDPLRFVGLLFIGSFSLTMLLTIATVWTEGRLSTRVYLWAGIDLLTTYLKADYAWIKQQNSAEFTRNIQESANLFAYNIVLPSARIMREATVFIAVSATALIARPELAPLTLVLASVYALVHWLPYLASDRLGSASETVKKEQYKALEETYNLFTEIRINGLLAPYLERFARPRRGYRRILVLRQLNELIPARVAEWLVMALVIGLIIWLGPALNSEPAGQLWMQTIVFALYLAVRLRGTLTSLLSNLLSLRFGWAAFLNVEKGLRETPPGFTDEPSVTVGFHRSLRLVNVGYVYPGSDAGIRNIDLEIRCGEWIGLEGRSGAGKTTLAAVIMGLVRPQTGHVLVDDVPLSLNHVAWYRNIGFVSQQFAIIDDTLAANVTLCPPEEVDARRLEEAVKLARLEGVIAATPGGLGGRVGEDGGLLSGGQRQRIALARALYREARLLVLDEATSALDSETEAEILRDLERLRGRITVVVIAHRDSMLDQCDRVLRLDGGRISSFRTLDRNHTPDKTGVVGLRTHEA